MSFLKTFYVVLGVILLQLTLAYPRRSDDIITRALQSMIDMHKQNDTKHEFLAEIQQMFCPEQPVCKQNNVIDLSNEQIYEIAMQRGANNTDIIQDFGLCCLPCSCDDDACAENDNCCLTKQADALDKDRTPVNRTIQNDCIAATSKSYFDKTPMHFKYPHYFMVTRCFINRDNVSLVTKCEKPDKDKIKADEMIPVYSKATNRTYWNKYCAICNDDYVSLVHWHATIHLNRHYLIFSHRSRAVTPSQNFSHFYETVVHAGELIYTKPDETEPNICIPKETIIQADEAQFHTLCHENQFLRDACQNFDSPAVVYGLSGPRSYKNIFCLLCQTGHMLQGDKSSCELDVYKGTRPSYTALLNHNFVTEEDLKGGFENQDTSENGCPCYTIFDSLQHICRPLFCPPDEFMILCKCMPFTSTTSGMAFVLLVKVRPVKGAKLPKEEKDELMALSAAVRMALSTRYKRIEFETFAIFYSNNTDLEYQLHVIRAREDQGYDAQDSFKELAECVEGPPFLRLVSKQYSYDAELTNTVVLWKDSKTGYKANDTKNKLELQNMYEDIGLQSTLRWSQELSKLLYCQQVELNGTEFIEDNGAVTLNASSVGYQTTHYYHPEADKIRICTEDFRKAFPEKVSSSVALSCSVAVVLGILSIMRL